MRTAYHSRKRPSCQDGRTYQFRLYLGQNRALARLWPSLHPERRVRGVIGRRGRTGGHDHDRTTRILRPRAHLNLEPEHRFGRVYTSETRQGPAHRLSGHVPHTAVRSRHVARRSDARRETGRDTHAADFIRDRANGPEHPIPRVLPDLRRIRPCADLVTFTRRVPDRSLERDRRLDDAHGDRTEHVLLRVRIIVYGRHEPFVRW